MDVKWETVLPSTLSPENGSQLWENVHQTRRNSTRSTRLREDWSGSAHVSLRVKTIWETRMDQGWLFERSKWRDFHIDEGSWNMWRSWHLDIHDQVIVVEDEVSFLHQHPKLKGIAQIFECENAIRAEWRRWNEERVSGNIEDNDDDGLGDGFYNFAILFPTEGDFITRVPSGAIIHFKK